MGRVAESRLAGWLAVGAVVAVAACAGGEDDRAGGTEEPSAKAVEGRASSAADAAGPWSAVSTGGTRVTVHVADVPLQVGPIPLVLEVHSDDPAVRPRSLDITSPSMPMHGVMRVAVEETADGRFRVTPEIPMEGDWAVYVNLDEGTDSAEFLFEVSEAGDSGGQNQGQHGTH